jgi:hypothetical protein
MGPPPRVPVETKPQTANIPTNQAVPTSNIPKERTPFPQPEIPRIFRRRRNIEPFDLNTIAIAHYLYVRDD